MRERVESHAADLALRGAPRHVLVAVLKLLCGYSRITDNYVGLHQIIELIVEAGARRYDRKTIGRALARLAGAELITYQPAQGRGARAVVAIHSRFVGDISVLERDASGRVIVDHSGRQKAESVTFSEPLPYRDQTHYPPTPRPETEPEDRRPGEVDVCTAELRSLMRALPAPLARLPRHLRWMLGAEIRRRLQAGWRPDQIQAVLAAQMPAEVERPWRLALWRLRHNMPGTGPRLRPLQQAWDARQADQQRSRLAETTARWHRDVTAVTTADQRAELLRADEVKFGRRSKDPLAALAAAGRRAARLFPEMPLAAALARWVDDTLGQAMDRSGAEEPLSAAAMPTDLLMDLAIGGGCGCVMCGSDRATARPELPLKSMVCERCWPHIAADLAGHDDTVEVACA